MYKSFKLLLAAGAFATLAACGGGGSSSTTNASGVVYTSFQQGGLNWSTPTSPTKLGFSSFSWPNSVVDANPQSNSVRFCSDITVNGSTGGWRIPTSNELDSLYRVMPKPSGWTLDYIFSTSSTPGRSLGSPTALNFGGVPSSITGLPGSGGGNAFEAYAVCVKAI